MNGLEIPKLEEQQWVALVCELKTGFVLDLEFRPQLDNTECFHYFDSFAKAEQFALETVKRYPEFEVNIYGYEDSDNHYYRNETDERLQASEVQAKKRTFMERVLHCILGRLFRG